MVSEEGSHRPPERDARGTAVGPGPVNRRRRGVLYGLTALLLVLLGGLAGGVAAIGLDQYLNGVRCPVARTAARVLPAVVTLSIRNGAQSSNGSGQVLDQAGNILTNDHVVAPAGPNGTIDVVFDDGLSVRATVVGRATALDLAVVRIQPDGPLPVIRIGTSSTLRVGQPVIALGAPLGLSSTVTSGIVSALGRDVPVPTESGAPALLPGAVQIDAAINPGNSGGALVDCSGRLVGINTAIATVPNAAGESGGGSVGIGFAIPVDLAMGVAGQLIERGRFTPAYFGAVTTPVSSAVAQRYRLDGGLIIQSVTPGGPAAQADLRVGDIVVEMADRPTRAPDSIWLITLGQAVGQRLTVQYVRGGQQMTANVTLGSGP